MLDNADNDAPTLDPDSDSFAKYVLTCARLGVTPVSTERAANLIRQFTDALNQDLNSPSAPASISEEQTK